MAAEQAVTEAMLHSTGRRSMRVAASAAPVAASRAMISKNSPLKRQAVKAYKPVQNKATKNQ